VKFVFRITYDQPEAENELARVLSNLLTGDGEEVIFLCIGTDKNILDCLGPLVGTMLQEAVPEIPVYGTLDNPVHAKNLVPVLREINKNHPRAREVAVDACLGRPEEIGLIKLREGSLFPGKALNKALPAVGDISLTGTVAAYPQENKYRDLTSGSFAPVYHIARVITQGIRLALGRQL